LKPHVIAIDCEMCESTDPVTEMVDNNTLIRFSVVNGLCPSEVRYALSCVITAHDMIRLDSSCKMSFFVALYRLSTIPLSIQGCQSPIRARISMVLTKTVS
jgi:hypothetical protein